MAKKTLLHKVSLEQLIAVAAASISVVFLLAFGSQILEIYRLRAAQSIAEARLEELRREQAALEATRAYVGSDEYAEKVARAELNQVRPGDHPSIIVVRPAPAPTSAPIAAPTTEAPPPPDYLHSWWELLFGG